LSVCLSVCLSLFTFCTYRSAIFNPISAPSAPPSRFGVSARDSQSLLVYWLDVPPEHRNGIIRGYRLAYTSASNGTGTVMTTRTYSKVLTQLQKATEYTIEVWAFNDAGDGVPAWYTTWTGEDGKRHWLTEVKRATSYRRALLRRLPMILQLRATCCAR